MAAYEPENCSLLHNVREIACAITDAAHDHLANETRHWYESSWVRLHPHSK